MISLWLARQVLDRGEKVDLKFWKKNGEIVDAKQVVCTSSQHASNTFKFKFSNGQFRDVKAVLLKEINGEEIVI